MTTLPTADNPLAPLYPIIVEPPNADTIRREQISELQSRKRQLEAELNDVKERIWLLQTEPYANPISRR